VECYSLTCKAFDLAERFRIPVFLATDKETALTLATVDLADFEPVPVRERSYAPEDGEFVPYRVAAPDEVPPMSPMGGAHIVRFTTSTHDEYGQLSKTPVQVKKLNERLAEKVEAHLDEIAMVKTDIQAGAETLLVGYGVTARAMEEAVDLARNSGKQISALTIYSLWPLPEQQIRDTLAGVRRVVVPELNLGQYQKEIERIAGNGVKVIGIHRVDGELISPQEILSAL
jgi:2-oxoglutarate ferredoxin oxidoreductase subunit alpha